MAQLSDFDQCDCFLSLRPACQQIKRRRSDVAFKNLNLSTSISLKMISVNGWIEKHWSCYNAMLCRKTLGPGIDPGKKNVYVTWWSMLFTPPVGPSDVVANRCSYPYRSHVLSHLCCFCLLGLRSEDTLWTLWDRAASDLQTDLHSVSRREQSTRLVVHPAAVFPEEIKLVAVVVQLGCHRAYALEK